MKKTIRIISMVLASVMMLLTLCSCKDSSYACTVDGVEYPVGPYAFYAHYTRDKYQAQAEAYGSTDFAADLVASLDEDGTKLYEYINYETQSSYLSHLIVSLKFDQFGLELTADQKKAMEEAVQANCMDEFGEEGFTDICRTLGITAAEFKEMVGVSYKYEALTNYLFGEGGIYEITEDELRENYNENYSRFRYIIVSKIDTETNKALPTDELIAKKGIVDTAYAEALAGADFGDLIAAYSEDYMTISDDMTDEEKSTYEARNKSAREDGIVTDKNGIFDYLFYYYYNQTLDSQIVDKAFSMNDGDIALIEIDSSFWVIQKMDKNEKADYFESKKDLIYSTISSPLLDEEFAKWEKEFSIVMNESVVSKYDPRKIGPLFYVKSGS